MRHISYAAKVMGALLLAACGSAPGTTDPPTTPTDPTTPPVITSYQAGLQSSGAIGFALAGDKTTRLEFSAPITPRTDVLYAGEGASYPATVKDQAALAHNASLTFKFLLAQCVASYSGTKVPDSDDEVLTPTQLSRNYDAVAQCSYEKFTAKPYWIPQLLDDVDICATELGTGWRMPTEADFADLQDADFDFLNQTLTTTASSAAGAQTWGSYYFSLTTYIRGTDGTLKLGNLTSGFKSRVTPLGVAPALYKNHLESSGSPLSLRCVRRTKS